METIHYRTLISKDDYYSYAIKLIPHNIILNEARTQVLFMA